MFCGSGILLFIADSAVFVFEGEEEEEEEAAVLSSN